MSLRYKNRLLDLLCKLIDWFLQGTNIGHLWLDKCIFKEKSK